MYGGVGAETAATRRRGAATRGQIVTYNGAPAITYFFSSSGGHTESVQNVWPGATPEPWLRGVPDPYDGAGDNPYHHWGQQMSLGAAASALGSLVKGTLIGIKVTKHGVSPRILEAGSSAPGRTHRFRRDAAADLRAADTYAAFTTISTGAAAGELGGTSTRRRATARSRSSRWQSARGARSRPRRSAATGYSVVSRAGPLPDRVPRTRRPDGGRAPAKAVDVSAALDAVAADALRGLLPSWVNVYAGSHAWPTARDRRAVRPVPLVLRAP